MSVILVSVILAKCQSRCLGLKHKNKFVHKQSVYYTAACTITNAQVSIKLSKSEKNIKR